MTAHQIGLALILLLAWCIVMAGAIEVAIAVANWWRRGGGDLARALNQAAQDGRNYGRRDR